ncbi:hypothetical protein GCM10009741_27110 [Kribbella lupini]|uniref:Uncharacterized protein n=1 Tax=Kribbella lupini TaxID=291602 RepID=A0ABN2AST2_9ACTN
MSNRPSPPTGSRRLQLGISRAKCPVITPCPGTRNRLYSGFETGSPPLGRPVRNYFSTTPRSWLIDSW